MDGRAVHRGFDMTASCARVYYCNVRPFSPPSACTRLAVGTRVASRPPHRSVRAAFPHTAPTSGIDDTTLPYASLPLVSRLSGSESGTCLVGPHSPWSLSLAPPTPLRIAPLCSSASQLLRQGLLGSVHHRLRLLTFPMRAGSGSAVPISPEISQLPMQSFCT